MTSLGKNGLNIMTNASTKWDRTRCTRTRKDLFPEAEPREIGMVKGNQNLANFRNGIL